MGAAAGLSSDAGRHRTTATLHRDDANTTSSEKCGWGANDTRGGSGVEGEAIESARNPHRPCVQRFGLESFGADGAIELIAPLEELHSHKLLQRDEQTITPAEAARLPGRDTVLSHLLGRMRRMLWGLRGYKVLHVVSNGQHEPPI